MCNCHFFSLNGHIGAAGFKYEGSNNALTLATMQNTQGSSEGKTGVDAAWLQRPAFKPVSDLAALAMTQRL